MSQFIKSRIEHSIAVTPKVAAWILTGALIHFAALSTGLSTAQAAPGEKAGCPNIDASLAISVAANASEFRKEDGKVILRGDVTIDQGVLHLAADEVTIEYIQGETRDKGAQGKVNSLLARGTVKIECESDRAHGGEALYDVAKQTLELKHNVLLVRGDNILKGETLFIDLATGHTTIAGGGTPVSTTDANPSGPTGDTRIKAVFTPSTASRTKEAVEPEATENEEPSASETEAETGTETNPEE